jgi:hypothetical protein
LGSNLTLNAAINPDFGQVEIDPAVVNLTQYETFYTEKRPFFVDGANFFSFGGDGLTSSWSFNTPYLDLFYSRRVGRPPEGVIPSCAAGNVYADVPATTRILGAAKLTGKIGSNTTLGVLEAVTDNEHASVDSCGVRSRQLVEPAASSRWPGRSGRATTAPTASAQWSRHPLEICPLTCVISSPARPKSAESTAG